MAWAVRISGDGGQEGRHLAKKKEKKKKGYGARNAAATQPDIDMARLYKRHMAAGTEADGTWRSLSKLRNPRHFGNLEGGRLIDIGDGRSRISAFLMPKTVCNTVTHSEENNHCFRHTFGLTAGVDTVRDTSLFSRLPRGMGARIARSPLREIDQRC